MTSAGSGRRVEVTVLLGDPADQSGIDSLPHTGDRRDGVEHAEEQASSSGPSRGCGSSAARASTITHRTPCREHCRNVRPNADRPAGSSRRTSAPCWYPGEGAWLTAEGGVDGDVEAALGAGGAQVGAVGGGDRLDDGEAEAVAVGVAGAAGRQALERLKSRSS